MNALTEALECVKSAGLIRRYSLVWDAGSDAPRIHVWKATDAPDEALRRSIAGSLAGLAAESQLTIEKDESPSLALGRCAVRDPVATPAAR
jgi:hypothetical protein